MNIYLIGAGCGSMGTRTLEATEKLEACDLIIGARRLVEGLPERYAGKCIPAHKPDIIAQILRDSGKPRADGETRIGDGGEKRSDADGAAWSDDGAKEKCVVLLLSGDSGFYSGTARLLRMIDELRTEYPDRKFETEILPGISSLQYFAAKIERPWQDLRLVSAHGHDCDAVYEVMQGKDVFFLTGGKYTPAQIAEDLCRAGLGSLSMIIGENLSYGEAEKISRGKAEEFAGRTFAQMSVVLCEAAPCYEGPRYGISDDAFVRGNVPMTKMEVRAVLLAKMGTRPGDIVWDVGAGTGSVSVELSRTARRVHAIECLPEACELIRKNREKFCAWNIEVVSGMAPEALEHLPAPDRIFIGGSRGNLEEIIRAAVMKNPDVRICLTAVTLETLTEAGRVLSSLGREADISLISVSRAEAVGSVHMMKAMNPVYVICG